MYRAFSLAFFLSIMILCVPMGARAGGNVEIQGVERTSTEDVFIGNILISTNPDYKFKIVSLKSVISHFIKAESKIDYRGFLVNSVTVLGYDGMEIGVITLSEDDGIIDYEVVTINYQDRNTAVQTEVENS